MTRKEARALGLKVYTTGSPCIKGHPCERYVCSANCVTCLLEKMTARYLQSVGGKRKQHRDVTRAARRAARIAGLDFFVSGDRCVRNHAPLRYVQSGSCWECERERAVRRNADPIERARQRGRGRIPREKRVEYERAYRARHPDRCKANYGAKRAAKKVARAPWANHRKLTAIYREARLTGMQVDHVVPLQHRLVCGLHWEGNLQLLPASENARKGNRHWPDMP